MSQPVRLLFLPDTHLKLRNPSNRVDMIGEGIALLEKIADDVIPNNQIDVIIHGGDLFDRGEQKLPTQQWTDMMTAFDKMCAAVNGNMFLTLGNHEYTYSRHNPTFMITDVMDEKVKEIYKYKDRLDMIKPIWRSPAYIDLGETIIHLMHYRPTKDYKIKYHQDKTVVGIYHDDLVSFNSKEELYHHRIGKGINITDTNIFENVDVAICGHIHTPLLEMKLQNGRGTRVLVPGSLVNNNSAEKHQYVDLPILSIMGRNVGIEYVRYKLPEYSESFDEDVVDKNKSLYEFSKLMKSTKNAIKETNLFNEMLAKMNNTELEILIRKSDEPIKSVNIENLQKFIEEE